MHAPEGTTARIDQQVGGCQASSRPAVLTREPEFHEVSNRVRPETRFGLSFQDLQAEHLQTASAWFSLLRVPDLTLSANGNKY